MADTKGAQAAVKELKKLADGGGSSADADKALLNFKVALSSFQHLPPSTQITKGSKAERSLAMQGYEYACILSANRTLGGSAMEEEERENESLMRHVLLLRPYYFDYRAELGDSSKRTEIIALELLALLVGQKLGEFYSLLERIPMAERSDKYISFVCGLEKNLMEGNYNQLLSARKKSPSKLYKTLLGELEITVRNEVASCIEQAYPKISLDAAAKLMNCKKDMVQAIADRKETWIIDKDGLLSFNMKEEKKAEIPQQTAKDLIRETLNYANEMEKIV